MPTALPILQLLARRNAWPAPGGDDALVLVQIACFRDNEPSARAKIGVDDATRERPAFASTVAIERAAPASHGLAWNSGSTSITLWVRSWARAIAHLARDDKAVAAAPSSSERRFRSGPAVWESRDFSYRQLISRIPSDPSPDRPRRRSRPTDNDNVTGLD